MTTWTKSSAESFINDLYKTTLGRDAVFGSNFTDRASDSAADADYWTQQLMSGALKGDGDLAQTLQGSAEFKNRSAFIDNYKAANAGAAPDEATIDANIGVGGVKYATAANPTNNLQDQYANNTWLQNFGVGQRADGTSYAVQVNDPLAEAKNHALAISNQAGTAPGSLISALTTSNGGSTNDGSNNTGGDNTGNTNNYLTSDDLTSWWDKLDKSSFTGNQKQGGMDDFMKFMMLMNVMGGNRGGGGFGGSQYGYGGLNPGGVMQAYDPLAQLQGMGTWFKDNFGSGGATTSTVNTGTT